MPALSLMLHLISNSHEPADQSISPERVCLCLYVSTNMHICVGLGVCSDLWFHIRYVSHAVDFFSYHHLSEFPLSLVCKNTLFHVAKSTLPLIALRFSNSLSYHEILQQIHDEPELLFSTAFFNSLNLRRCRLISFTVQFLSVFAHLMHYFNLE